MSSTFTPSDAVDVSKERDWPMHLGMLDWDDTKIVFTKRSLVEFLKYTGVTVDPGFTNIQKLPRHAQFGKFVAISGPEEEEAAEDTTSPTSGTRSHRLLEDEFPEDALATAPPKPEAALDLQKPSAPKPSRRVRTGPGGRDSIGNIFSNEDDEQQFIPTRRVRQRPGGQDNIEGLF